jgi:transposase
MPAIKEAFRLSKKERKQMEKRRQQGGDHRVVRRLCALLWLDEGRTQEEVAGLLGTTSRIVRDWINLYRKGGLEKVCDLGYRGRSCNLNDEQIEALREEIKAGRFRAAKEVRQWLQDELGVTYSLSGVKELLRRLGASFHKTTALMFKADREAQKRFLKKISPAKATAR